ncbi:zinc knuckle CX2CX4HX4C containing protein [Tanacetum coccineum]
MSSYSILLEMIEIGFLERVQDELPSSVGLDFELDETMAFTTDRLIGGSPCGGIDMVIKDLDLEPKIDATMMEFLEVERTLVVAIPKFMGKTYTLITIHVQYEWTPPRCSSCKVFGHVLNDFPKKIVSDVLKNLRNPRQVIRVVYVGPNVCSKVQFKPTKQVYQPVFKRNDASSSGKKGKLD